MKLRRWLISILVAAIPISALAQDRKPPPPYKAASFVFGASAYPELQTPDEVRRMLDAFQAAGFNTVRVGESAWGILEPSEGDYEFGWLRSFLDELERRHMKAVLGTGSYIAPQWLIAKHPDIRAELIAGQPLNPLLRKAASIHHPVYIAAALRFARAYAAAFKDHPAVIGWQLDNEIDALVLQARRCTATLKDRCGQIDRSAAAQRAFTAWLTRNYSSAADLNQRWGLRAWGMEVGALSDVNLPTEGYEANAPLLDFAYRRFLRDEIAGLLEQQASAIKSTGARQWVTTNFMGDSRLGSDDRIASALSVSGINAYGFSTFNSDAWSSLARDFDVARSATGNGTFLTTEVQAGQIGGFEIWDGFSSAAQARMAVLLPVAYGSSGSLYWSGNRFAAGHWPHWGALLTMDGDADNDLARAADIGRFIKKWGRDLIRTPVSAKVAIITDFDQVIAHESYTHAPDNVAETSTSAFFEAFHRIGIGVDRVGISQAATLEILKKYEMIVVSSPSALSRDDFAATLQRYAAQGGTVVVAPLTAYQTSDGVVRKRDRIRGLAALTGADVTAERFVPLANGAGAGSVTLGGQILKTGGSGYFEVMNGVPDSVAAAIAPIEIADDTLSGRPAIIVRKIGSGQVFKLAFWPERSQFPTLLRLLKPLQNDIFDGVGSRDVHAIPRADGSMFIVNTGSTETTLTLRQAREDRLSGRRFDKGSITLKPFDIFWLR